MVIFRKKNQQGYLNKTKKKMKKTGFLWPNKIFLNAFRSRVKIFFIGPEIMKK